MTFIKKNKKNIVLLLIIAIGFFLRTYNHNETLHFQSDQSRDAIIIDTALKEGLTKLPLLGPQARSSDLLLGPIFYYFQYGAAYIFSNNPSVLAWPDLLFSILTIPLLYLFFRIYFSQWQSIGLTGIAGTSLFLVEYARFAWNPNSLPFFTLLMGFGLLRAFRNPRKISFLWWHTSIFGLTVASQLHFIFFLAGPIIFILFIFYNKKKLPIKHILYTLGMILILYFPVFVSEYKTKGNNTIALFETITNKGSSDAEHNIAEKFFRSYQNTSIVYWIIFTGDQHGDIILTRGKNIRDFKILCDNKCKTNLPYTIFASLIFGIGIIRLVINYQKEKDYIRKQFLFLILIWLGIIFFVLIFVAYQISPRFYLTLIVPFFVLFGITLTDIQKKIKFFGKYFIGLIFFITVLLNLYQSFIYLRTLSSAFQNSSASLGRDLILLRDDVITFKQLEMAANYLHSNIKEENNLSFVADNRYARSIAFILNKEYSSNVNPIKLSDFDFDGKEYYFILKTNSDKKSTLKKISGYTLIQQKEFGTLSIYKLTNYNYVD